MTILAGIVFLNSCRQNDEDQNFDYQLKGKDAVKNESSKSSDSIQELSNLNEFDEKEIDYQDPPPKNGGQWRVKK